MSLPIRPFTLALVAVLTLWLGACATATDLDGSIGESPTAPGTTEVAVAPSGGPILNGSATVEMLVNGSPIVLEIDGANAPVTAGNFVDLVNRGVYDGLVFHRVVKEPQPFVAQGGDPQSSDPNVPAQQLGTGSFIDPDTQAPRYIPLEIKPAGAADPIYSQTFEEARIAQAPELRHTRGALAMARSQAVDSASAQFYITLAELPFLDGSYAVFGYVTSGMEVVDAIEQGDRIESARVISGLENLQTE